MRLLLEYLARQLLVSMLCAATQTSLVDHEHRQLRIDPPGMNAAADGSREETATHSATARPPEGSTRRRRGASSHTTGLAEASQQLTDRGSAAGSTSAPG